MTRGERIAWIWVWSTVSCLSLAAAFLVWRSWALPFLYFETHMCESSATPASAQACEGVFTNEEAPENLRLRTLRRAVVIADDRRDYWTVIKRVTTLIELNGATAEDLNLRGIAYYTLRDFESAAKDFAGAIHLNRTMGTYWSNLADAQIETKKYKEAFDNYTTAMTNGNATAELLGNRGWASYQLGDYDKALADYDAAIAKDGRHADNLNERGLVHHALGEYESALADYTRSLELKPDEPVILTNRGITYARIGNPESARRDFDKAIAGNGNYELARVEKSWLLINGAQPESALGELQALEKKGPLSVAALEARSRAHLDLGDWQDTIGDADRALALGEISVWPYNYRSKAKRGLGDYEGSIADLSVMIMRDPKNIDLLATRAIMLQLAGRTQAALDEMSRAIADNNDPAYAYEIRSDIHLNSGHIAEAMADVRQAVTLAPNSAFSAAALGWVLLEDQKPADAIRECSRSLTIRETASAYTCRATAELALQKTEAAREDVRLAMDLQKRLGLVYLALGRIELTQGRPARAVERFSEALKFDMYKRAELLMYRGDAEAALGHIDSARADYEMARKFYTGLRAPALTERLAKLASQ
jgi:tetratricopeptide (TPR) repeat protein